MCHGTSDSIMHIYKNYYISNNLDESQDAMFKKKKVRVEDYLHVTVIPQHFKPADRAKSCGLRML